MRLLTSLAPAALLLAAGVASAASSWGFDAATVSVSEKKGDPVVEKFTQSSPASKTLALGETAHLRLQLTTKEGSKAKRPHQAFLLLREQDTGLEAPFALTVKETGKSSVELSQKDIPVQLLLAEKPLRASIVIGSFGSSAPLVAPAFDIEIVSDPSTPAPKYEAPVRYGKKPEIHHVFRADPKNPPKVISLFFTLAVVAALPALFIGWLMLGANLNHLGKAMGASPLSHAAFFGSVVAMEGVFFMYYTTWNLFQTLPVAGVVGAVAFLSGTRALGEVQSRRLAGER